MLSFFYFFLLSFFPSFFLPFFLTLAYSFVCSRVLSLSCSCVFRWRCLCANRVCFPSQRKCAVIARMVVWILHYYYNYQEVISEVLPEDYWQSLTYLFLVVVRAEGASLWPKPNLCGQRGTCGLQTAFAPWLWFWVPGSFWYGLGGEPTAVLAVQRHSYLLWSLWLTRTPDASSQATVARQRCLKERPSRTLYGFLTVF